MKENIRSRNLAINSYLGILAVTIVGGFAALFIIHVAIDVQFASFLQPQTYAIESSL